MNIIPVNDSPFFEEIADQSVNEDDIFEFNLIANDIDGDDLVLILLPSIMLIAMILKVIY